MTCAHEACTCSISAGASSQQIYCSERCETLVLRGAYEEDCSCVHASCEADRRPSELPASLLTGAT